MAIQFEYFASFRQASAIFTKLCLAARFPNSAGFNGQHNCGNDCDCVSMLPKHDRFG